MAGVNSPNSKPYEALPESDVNNNLDLLKSEFDDAWNQKLEDFYKALMQSMGTDFLLPSSPLSESYKKRAGDYSTQLKPMGYADKTAPDSFIFQTKGGHIYANHNNVIYKGDAFDAARANEIALLAAHDKDMINEGLTLKGSSNYQKSLLQLSILHQNKDITIHNLIADEALDPRAKAEFKALMAAQMETAGFESGGAPENAETPPEDITPEDIETTPVEEPEPVAKLSDDPKQYKIIHAYVSEESPLAGIDLDEERITAFWNSLNPSVQERILNTPIKKEDRISDELYNQTKERVLNEGTATRAFLSSTLKDLGFEGSMNKGLKQVTTRLDSEGVTQRQPGKARTVIQNDFNDASSPLLHAIKNTRAMVASVVQKLSNTLQEIAGTPTIRSVINALPA